MDSVRRQKLIWRCRRGMLELDLILQRFIANDLDQLSDAEMKDFECLLTYPDPDLFSWLMGSEPPQNKELERIIELIQLHTGVR